MVIMSELYYYSSLHDEFDLQEKCDQDLLSAIKRSKTMSLNEREACIIFIKAVNGILILCKDDIDMYTIY